MIGIATLVVYVQIQLVSLGLVVQVTFGESISSEGATIFAGVLMIAFVFFAGVRSAAFAAGVKDVLMLVVVVLLSATVAGKVGAGSLLDVFALAEAQHPGIGKFPGLDPASPTTTLWLMTTAINIALGNWVFPHLFQMSYAAHSATAIRRNAIWQPLYSLAYFFIILLGFAALRRRHPPERRQPQRSDYCSSWPTATRRGCSGLLAGTGFLLALVPGSLQLRRRGVHLHAQRRAAVAARSLRTATSLAAVARIARRLRGVIAVWLAISQQRAHWSRFCSMPIPRSACSRQACSSASCGNAPARSASSPGWVAGFVVVAVAVFHPASGRRPCPEWEPGLIAMAINFAVVGRGQSLHAARRGHAALSLMALDT